MGATADINYRQYWADDYSRYFNSPEECGQMYSPYWSTRSKELEQEARNQTTQEERDRNVTTALAEREVGSAAYQAARNQGLTGAEAQAIKGQSETATKGNATNIGAALRSTGQSTQNDYLQKMGYAKGLDMQSQNLQNAAFLNTIGGIFGGAGQGASVGASIGGGGSKK